MTGSRLLVVEDDAAVGGTWVSDDAQHELSWLKDQAKAG